MNICKSSLKFLILLIISDPVYAVIDPYTASAAAASAIGSIIDSNNRKAWEGDASKKLNEILGYQIALVEDLKQLRVDVSRITTESFTTFVNNTLESDINQFQLNLTNLQKFPNINRSAREQIVWNENNLERDIPLLHAYGPGTFMTTYAGILALRAVYELTNEDNQRKFNFYNYEANAFSAWLDVLPGYPAYIKKKEELLRDAKIIEARKLVGPGKYIFSYKGSRHKAPGNRKHWRSCREYAEILISGDIDLGFKTKVANTKITCDHPARNDNNLKFVYAKRALIQANLEGTRNSYLVHKNNIEKLSFILSKITTCRDNLINWTRAQPSKTISGN